MTVTTGTVNIYDSWTERVAKDVNLSSDSFKILLMSSSYTPSLSHAVLADITNELSGNGYARQTLGSVTFAQVSGVAKFDFADPQFTASGGSITARYWAIYDDTPTGDPLVAYGLLDSGVANVVATDGNSLTFNIDANGLFTISVAP